MDLKKAFLQYYITLRQPIRLIDLTFHFLYWAKGVDLTNDAWYETQGLYVVSGTFFFLEWLQYHSLK